MIYKTIPLQQPGSLPYAHVTTYLISHSDMIAINRRPLVIICPGGSYRFTSERVGEIVALQYNAMGYHAAVMYYSCAPAVYPTALTEVASAVLMMKQNAEEWHIDADHIIMIGFSAGAHLAADFCMNWSGPFLQNHLHCTKEQLKPAGMILGYPVITSGEYGHHPTFKNLLGSRYDELLEQESLEKRVSKDTPPAFIWHTETDEAVVVQNSLLLVEALVKQGIPTEYHLYPKGRHGLALASELTVDPSGGLKEPSCESWLSLSKTWLKNLCGELK
jgi:acetyl esterase/lipase